MTVSRGSAQERVLALLRSSTTGPLDDDEVAAMTGLNRHYVNQVCWRLYEAGLISRTHGPARKLVSAAVDHGQAAIPTPVEETSRARPRRRVLVNHTNVEELIAEFAGSVAAFEASEAFPGPSLYFHVRAIERRRRHRSVADMLADQLFLEYVYAVLPAWGMHRMGPAAAKVTDFAGLVERLREMADQLEELWPLRITELSPQQAPQATAVAWDVISHIRASTSATQIVAGSKTLHHLLPDLIPPIDRRYTFRFFTGQMSVGSDRAAFAEWLPALAEIAGRCKDAIRSTLVRGGFMATGEAKVLDNAIMGYMQHRGRRPA